TYLFKHALIQDAAYQSLLRSTRQQYHSQIAQILEERFAETKETQPELLAHHYTEAGLTLQAIPYWQRAGQRAIQSSAYVEAINHLTKGLELLKTLPDTTERAQQELLLQTTLGPALMFAKGHSAPEVGKAYTRARELCQQIGETPQLLPVLFGLCRFHNNRAELQTVRELTEQFLKLAHRVEPTHLVGAHYTLGGNLYWLGEIAAAREHLEQGIALYDRQKHHSLAFVYGTDPGVSCLSYLAWALWNLGYPDQARERVEEALALAQELSHPFSQALAGHSATRIHQLCREKHTTQEQAETQIAFSSDRGSPYWVVLGTIYRGWALAAQGQGEEGIAQMRQALAAHQAMGLGLAMTYYLSLLAEAYGTIGQTEKGLSVLAEALALPQKTGECSWEAELYRLKGELSLQSHSSPREVKTGQETRRWGSAHQNVRTSKAGTVGGAHPTAEAEAEECFLKAIEISQRQQAKSLELRAVISLGRLWQQQGKAKEAREMLAKIYGWFTEGFDTKDLQEAKVLLEELSH
ncbi:MAG TPA: tetratricopeptide repeat protein, partial [Candidatus Binatia bacterium]|nr:tetratricopeptide repeat protein [Candidatus Binatia bacterium]